MLSLLFSFLFGYYKYTCEFNDPALIYTKLNNDWKIVRESTNGQLIILYKRYRGLIW